MRDHTNPDRSYYRYDNVLGFVVKRPKADDNHVKRKIPSSLTDTVFIWSFFVFYFLVKEITYASLHL